MSFLLFEKTCLAATFEVTSTTDFPSHLSETGSGHSLVTRHQNHSQPTTFSENSAKSLSTRKQNKNHILIYELANMISRPYTKQVF